MGEKYRLLIINPGSTSTKIAIFEDTEKVFSENISHRAEDLSAFAEIADQKGYRKEAVLKAIQSAGFSIADMDAFVGRGGGTVSCKGGTYAASGILLEHATTCYAAKHPSVLGAILSHEFAKETGKLAFVVNPPSVDELQDVARITGVKGIYRKSQFHALNQKEIGHRAAQKLGKHYTECNFIIAHIGGGMSVAAHHRGQVVDTNDIIRGDGAFAPTRCGAIPVADVLSLYEANGKDYTAIEDLTRKTGGLVSWLGTSDTIEVERQVQNGDYMAQLVFDAMIYQIGKSIGSMASVLCGDVDSVVLTGGISNSKYLTSSLSQMCGYIAPIQIFAGEYEMEALAAGALRVLRNEEPLQNYSGKPIFSGFSFEHMD